MRSEALLLAALSAGLALGAPSRAARAQVAAVVKTADDIPAFDEAVESFRKAWAGEVVVESLGADAARWARIEEKLARKSPRVWVAVGQLALQQAAASRSARPVVFMMVATPEQSVRVGTAGVAGVSLRLEPGAQLKEVQAILPSARRLGVLFDPKNTGAEVAAAAAAARRVGLTLVTQEVTAPSGLGAALRSLLDEDVDALWLVADRTVTPPGSKEALEHVTSEALRAGVPVIGYAPKLTEAGALFSLGPSYADVGAQAADMARQVVGGASAEQVGVQPARRIELTLNQRVAATLGVKLPAAASARASQVFR